MGPLSDVCWSADRMFGWFLATRQTCVGGFCLEVMAFPSRFLLISLHLGFQFFVLLHSFLDAVSSVWDHFFQCSALAEHFSSDETTL